MAKLNKEYKQTYYEKLRSDPIRWEDFLTKTRIRYHKNAGERRRKEREYYANNSKRIIKRKTINGRKWRAKNPQKVKFKDYKQSARARGISFGLSLDDFLNLLDSNCHYCDRENANGIDRIDNKFGYSIENSRACCSMCNYMKKDYTEKEFLDQCKKISVVHS